MAPGRGIGAATLTLCLVALSAAPLRAQAQTETSRGAAETTHPKPVYVLPISTEDSDDQADALTRALRARVRATTSWWLVETSQSFDTLAIALRCPPKPDRGCLERVGDQLHANRYIWGTMGKRRGEVAVQLHLWSRGEPEAQASAAYPENLKDPENPHLRALASKLIESLAGGAAAGEPSAAGAANTGTAVGASSVVVGTAPGASGEAAPNAIDWSAESHARSSARVHRLVGFSAIAAGAVLVVVGGIEALRWVNDKNAIDQDRASVPDTVSDVCATPVNMSAVDACQKSHDAKSAATLGWIFGAAGVALAGAGAWLVVTASPHSAETGGEGTAGGTSRATPVGLAGLRLAARLGPASQSLFVEIPY